MAASGQGAMMKRHSRISIVIGFTIVFLSACQNEARWYPSAEVSIGNQSEYTDMAGVKYLAVSVIVHNTSNTSILSGAVTLKAITNRREYLSTTSFTNKIIPGGKVALPVSVAYLEPDEVIQPNGTAVYSSFFD